MKKRYLILLLPLAFVFHFLEIQLSAVFALPIILFLALITAFSTVALKKRYVLLLKLAGAAISIMLATLFIVAPNPSWFNPFSMEMAMVFSELVICMLILLLRSVFKRM